MRRRTSERGAALFVIVLVVSLLTAIGVFAMHATSLAQLGSGYSRRQATAVYLAEFAGNLRSAIIADDVNTYVETDGKGVDRTLPRPQQNNCYYAKDQVALLTAPQMPFCVPWGIKDIRDAASNLGTDPEGLFGTLNRPDAPTDQVVTASIRIESTDHMESPRGVPGFPSNDKTASWLDTLTITGILQPTITTTSDMCTAAVTRASETDRVRGIVLYTQINAK